MENKYLHLNFTQIANAIKIKKLGHFTDAEKNILQAIQMEFKVLLKYI